MTTWKSFKIANVALLLLTWLALGSLAKAQEDSPVAALDDALDVSVTADDLPVYLLPLTAADLAAVAESWQNHVRSELSDLVDTNLALRQAEGAQEEILRKRFAAESGEIGEALEKYGIVLDAWAFKGGAQEDIASHQSYADAAAKGTLRTTDFKTLAAEAWNWLTARDGGLRLVLGIMSVVLAIWTMIFLARFVLCGWLPFCKSHFVLGVLSEAVLCSACWRDAHGRWP